MAMSGVAWGLDELPGGELRAVARVGRGDGTEGRGMCRGSGGGEMGPRLSLTLISASAQELSEAGPMWLRSLPAKEHQRSLRLVTQSAVNLPSWGLRVCRLT